MRFCRGKDDLLGSLKMKDNKRLGPWPDITKPAFTRNSKIYEYMLSTESDRVSFPRLISIHQLYY